MEQSVVEVDIFAFDINDTITLLNNIDPQKKDSNVGLCQLVCQNIRLPHWGGESLEDVIRKLYATKKEQRDQYVKSVEQENELYNTLKEKWDKCQNENNGLFYSFTKVVDYITENFPNSIILLHSFGDEIRHTLDVLHRQQTSRRNQKKPYFNVEYDIIDLKNGVDKIHTSSDRALSDTDKIYSDFIPNIIKFFDIYANGNVIVAIKDCYQLWKEGKVGKLLFYHTSEIDNYIECALTNPEQDVGCYTECGKKKIRYRTVFFDDNADIVAHPVYRGEDPDLFFNTENGAVQHNIFQVDTSKALLDDDYFINIIQKLDL